MHTINLKEFRDYNATELYEYIMVQNETEYKIIFQKEMVKNVNDNFDVFWEYHLAAFIGQRLFEIAEAFAYYVPSINKKQSFTFDIDINDPEKLSDTLFFLIKGLYEKDFDITIQFHEEATRLFTESFENEELLVACWGLIEIANRHLD